MLEVTGCDNYSALGKALGMSAADAADFVRTPQGAVQSACWVWSTFRLNPLADLWRLTAITKRLNGGLTGLATRLRLSNLALTALGAPFARPPVPVGLVPFPRSALPIDLASAAIADPDNSSDALNDAELARIRALG
jgi:hypothetical protein